MVLDTTHESYIYIILAAATAAYHLGIDEKTIIEAICQPVTRNRRFEKKALSYDNSFMIDDAYNASPESTSAGLKAFDKIPWSGKKIVVLGDMLALGDKSMFYHKQIGKLFFKLLSIDHLILVGNRVHCMTSVLPKTLVVQTCATLQEAKELVNGILQENTFVLFKASLGMNFVELVNYYSMPHNIQTL